MNIFVSPPIQKLRSLVLAVLLSALNPHVLIFASNLSTENGIPISAIHPSVVILHADSQLVSQLTSTVLPLSVKIPSLCVPMGLTAKK
ncbi:hypothetical protein ACFL1R_06790 [Candidatus Latescibacterota bacterium]